MSYDLLADSAGGLVCAIAKRPRRGPGSRDHTSQYWKYDPKCWLALVVFNPFTGQSRALPTPPSTLQFAGRYTMKFTDPQRMLITMLATPATSSYHIILCCHRCGARYCSAGMLIFSSQTNHWTSVAASNSWQRIKITAASMHHAHGWRTSTDLILRADFFEWDANQSLILGCSLHPQVTWWELPSPSPLEAAPRDCNAVPLFFIHRGRLLFAWLMFTGFLATGFTVWELQPGCSTGHSRINWVLLAQTPTDLQEPIGGWEEEAHVSLAATADYKLIHSGSLVCLVIANFSDDILNYADEDYFLSSLTYDLDQGSWSRLPPVDEAAKLRMLFTGGFSFQPSFMATVY